LAAMGTAREAALPSRPRPLPQTAPSRRCAPLAGAMRGFRDRMGSVSTLDSIEESALPTTFTQSPVRRAQAACAAAALMLLAGCASVSAPVVAETPGCLGDIAVNRMLADYNARRPAPNPPETMTMADARCTRSRLQQRLAGQDGRLAGYKAGLTSTAAQQRFHTDQPVWGALYTSMLLGTGATVDAAFGARPLYEADLLVRVKSEAINHARTPAEVLDQVDQIIGFIELPDLTVEAPARINGVGLTAINVGARLGVRGAPLQVPPDGAARGRLLDELRDMNVRLLDAQGAQLGGGKGADLLGHPLNAVVWLAGALKAEGLSLRPGQLISLGSISALLPPKPGLQVTAQYDGVTGLQPVTVTFR